MSRRILTAGLVLLLTLVAAGYLFVAATARPVRAERFLSDPRGTGWVRLRPGQALRFRFPAMRSRTRGARLRVIPGRRDECDLRMELEYRSQGLVARGDCRVRRGRERVRVVFPQGSPPARSDRLRLECSAPARVRVSSNAGDPLLYVLAFDEWRAGPALLGTFRRASATTLVPAGLLWTLAVAALLGLPAVALAIALCDRRSRLAALLPGLVLLLLVLGYHLARSRNARDAVVRLEPANSVASEARRN